MSVRDKYLTEAMGGRVYNKLDHPEYYVSAGNRIICRIDDYVCDLPDFSTWQGFGNLWEWAQDQDWWQLFIERYGTCYYPENVTMFNGSSMWCLPDRIITPDHFANAVYEFLKGRES